MVFVGPKTNASKGFLENNMLILFFAVLILLLFFLILQNVTFLNDMAEEIAILLSGKKI